MKKYSVCFLYLLCSLISLQLNSQNLIVEYEFDGTLSDKLNNSTLTAFGPANDGYNRNNVESGFLEDEHGTYWYWLSNLARGGGFRIDINQDISASYTVALRFSFNSTGSSLGSGYRKIIDYANSGSDNGFYYHGYRLNFYPVGTGTSTISNNQLVDLIATRESDGRFKAYFVVNGVLVIPPELNVLTGANSKPTLVNGKPRFGFFFDDTATGSEATNGGKVYSIKIWDAALSESEIQESLNPKATVANVNIVGITGSPISPKDVVINLHQGETISNNIAQNTNLSSWITNLPSGLNAIAKTTINSGDTIITLEVNGTPSVVSSAAINIIIPGSALTNASNVIVATNPNAKYGIAPYKVIYNGNSQTAGISPSDANDYYEGSSVTVLGNTGSLVKTGYVFNGWNTAQNGSGVQYSEGQTLTIGTSNVILYARWIPSGLTLPTITTQNANNIDETTATLNGNITALGSSNPTAHGFCYSTNENPAIHNATCVNRGSASTTGAFLSNISGLISGVTYYVRAYATNTAGTSYGQQVSFTTKEPYYWTGNFNNDWNNVSNWNIAVPTNLDKAIISNVPNKPVISNGINAEAKSLIVDQYSSVTINQGGKLTVAEDLLNNGTITIKSTAAGDGSLITNTISGSGTYKVERYLAANKWHLVSSPITNGMSGIFAGIWLRPYNENTNAFGAYITPTNVPLTPGQGFSNWTYNNETRTFSGTINNGAVGPIDLPRTNLGWNLIGNPYPSAIDWNAATGWTKTNVANSVYVWNGELGQYATWNGTAATNGGSRYIPMGQGFFVQASSVGASIAMNNNVRIHNLVAFMKNEDPANIIRIKVATAESSDESVIAVRSGVMDEFDYQFDATKLRGDVSAPQLYTKKADTEVAICAYSDVFKVFGQFVYFEPYSSSEHVLLYTHTLDGADVPLLFDHITGATIYPNVSYTFIPTANNITKRFEFIKGSPTSINEATADNIMVWESNGTLYIDNLGDEILKEVKIFDMQGKLVYVSLNKNRIDVSCLKSAMYVVTVETNKGVVNRKIVVN